MKRIIETKNGIIGGADMQTIVKILPQLKDSFKQRKNYLEYYFDATAIEISLEEIDELSFYFSLRMSYFYLVIDI